MSPLQAWLSPAGRKLRFNRFGATGRSCRLSVVATRKRPLAPSAAPVLLHQPLYPLLAYTNAVLDQLPPDARPAVGSAMFRVHRTDMGQQCRITQVPTLHLPPCQVLMKPRHACLKHPPLHTDRPAAPMAFDAGILHFWPFAKNAVAFPTMSRSIFTRASSARKRLISICSGVTPVLLPTSFSFPARFALTQFDSVCSTTPRLRAASAMLCPDSTSRTASSLNSSVYLPRFPFLIYVPFPLLKQFPKGYVLRGQAHSPAGRFHRGVSSTESARRQGGVE